MLEFDRTPYGWHFAINHRHGLGQHFAVWWLHGCDCGVYLFGKHFVRSLAR